MSGPRAAPFRVALAALLLQIAASALLRHESRITGDGRFYERMASHPSGPHNFPYAYRVGIPWLVHALPFSNTASFTLLAWLAIAAAAAAMYALLRELGTETSLAWALSLGFSLSPPLLVVLLRDGRSVDPATILVLTLGVVLIVRRQRLPLALTLLAGTTIHESCLLLVPLAYAVWARRPIDLAAARDLLLTAALPVAVYAWLRATIATAGSQYIPGYSGPFLDARLDVLARGHSIIGTELRRIAVAFGPLWLGVPFALTDRGSPGGALARRGMVLLPLGLASMTFALDWGRIAFFAAPIVYVAGVTAVRTHRRLAAAMALGLFALDIVYAIYMQAYGVTHGLDAVGSTSQIPLY